MPSEAPGGEAPIAGGVKPANPASAPVPGGLTTIDLAQSASISNTVSKNDFVLNGTTPRPNQGVMLVIHKVGGRGAPLGSEITRVESDATGHFTLKGHLGEGAGNYRVDVGFKDPVLQNSFPTAKSFSVASTDAVNDPPPPVYGAPPAPIVSNLAITANVAQPDSKSAIMSMTRDPSSPNVFYGLSSDPHAHTLNIMRSDDGGQTWHTASQQPSNSGSPGAHITVGPRQKDGSQSIFVSNEAGLFISGDQGKTLIPVNGTRSPKTTDVKLSEDGNHLVVGYGGHEGVQIFERDEKTGAWAPSSKQPSDLVAFIGNKYNTAKECRKTADGFVNDNCPYSQSTDDKNRPIPLKVWSVQIDPSHPDVVYAGMGRHLYRWDGKDWSILNKGVSVPGSWISNDTTVSSIEVNKKTGILSMTTCQGIFQAQVDGPNGGAVKPNVQFTKVRPASLTFIDPRSGNGNRLTPSYLRAWDVQTNPANPDQMVVASASGIYLKNKGQWTRLKSGLVDTLDPNPTQASTKVEYRSAVWAKDGSYVIVSGQAGTFKVPVNADTTVAAAK